MKIPLAIAACVGLMSGVVRLVDGFQLARPLDGIKSNAPTRPQSALRASPDPQESDKGDDKSQIEESAALKWAAEQKEEPQKAAADMESDSSEEHSNGKRKKYVVVGAGWGGWGAAKVCLCGYSQCYQSLSD